MDRPPPDGPSGTRGAAGATAAWVLVVQCLLALSWTLYVLFLPGMLAAAGIERRWFVYVLIVDQAVFAACDWTAGRWADRIGQVRRRLGRAITAFTLLSSVALLAMPWVARPGNATPLLALIFIWAATSSALRAPVFALLGRVRESTSSPDDMHPATIGRAGAIAIALVGVSLAGAVGPYLALLLKGVDARLPIAVSAVALAAAGLWAAAIDDRLPHQDATDAPDRETVKRATRRAWSLALVVLVAAFGTQTLAAIVAPPLFQRFVGADAALWVAWFWAGFGVGLVPGAWLAGRRAGTGRPPLHAALALVVACAAFALGKQGDAVALLAAGVALAGAAWGVFSTAVFACAVSLSGGRATTRGFGTASGMLFSALAIGTLLRLACVAGGWSRGSLVVWLPEIAWALASVLLVVAARTVWGPRRALTG